MPTDGSVWDNWWRVCVNSTERGGFMLSKCANPDCSTVFRYPHEGNL